ncbi:crossover junction endodeoxyribonuclease RuvC [Paenibacillus agricola]|uniref:Crossover junction endodeoxyribonuclease RuvC n=1 Tax=Paenibacillus agricola TaxID=2716264 RepID=A0ABX0J4A9_9BACL|nr:crossover junction endodeoxyribonuclease RuvC [Paenibacillus agricola]
MPPNKPERKPKAEVTRYLGLDLSLSPGAACIAVKNRIPTLIAADSVATSNADNDAIRSHTVESFIAQFIYTHRPALPLRFAAVIREDFTSGRNKRATQTIFSAWAASDRALHAYGYGIDAEISPTSVKKIVTGNGRAEKPEVADHVRRILRLGADHTFKSGYDDSDALGVCLAYLIREELIDVC